MATHCSILAWETPWAEEQGGLQSMRLQRVGHDWVAEHTHGIFHLNRLSMFMVRLLPLLFQLHCPARASPLHPLWESQHCCLNLSTHCYIVWRVWGVHLTGFSTVSSRITLAESRLLWDAASSREVKAPSAPTCCCLFCDILQLGFPIPSLLIFL